MGHQEGDRLYHYLPPRPARIHAFVHLCDSEEVQRFSQSLGFLSMLVNARLPVPPDELIGAALRLMCRAHADPDAFLITAGKELASLLGGQYDQLKSILGRLK